MLTMNGYIKRTVTTVAALVVEDADRLEVSRRSVASAR
jgi:hypothetical protein